MLLSPRTAVVLMGMCSVLLSCGERLEQAPSSAKAPAQKRGLGAQPTARARFYRAGKNGVPDRYIVVFSDTEAQSLRASPLEVRKAAEGLAAEHGASVRRVFSSALKGFSVSMTEAEALRLSEDPRVRYVEQERTFTIQGTQSNPDWGLDRIDQHTPDLDNRYTYEYTGAGVHVYVLDTGIRATHTEFAGRIGEGFDSIQDGNGTDDCNGHGTHVAGSAGGTLYGVAKGVTIHPVRVVDCTGNGTNEQVLAGIDWILQNHISPSVVNVSLTSEITPSVDDAVSASIAAGVTYVVGAGNDLHDACDNTPARVPEAITVGASDEVDMMSFFSNFGPCVDIFAPGEDITSAWNTGDTATETLSGTSMSTPHVTGAAALYLEGHPTATPAEVSHELSARATQDALGGVEDSPNVLLYTACMGATDPVPPQATITAPADGVTLTGTVTLSATASDDVSVARVEFYVGGALVGTAATAPYTITWNSNDAPNGPTTVTARAFDSGCNSQDSSVSVTIQNTGKATYDPVFRAPVCADPSSQCDTGTLLAGRGPLGPELNTPNTLGDSCVDGTFGDYQLDPSLEAIKIVRPSGGLLAEGAKVRVDITLFSGFDSSSERLELYSAPDARAPVWTHIATLNAWDFGPNIMSIYFTLPAGDLQAIRGVYRYGGLDSSCPGGSMDDVDDLVFSVVHEVDTEPPTATLTFPSSGAALTKTVTLTATASDNFGVTQVEFYDGTTLLGTDTTEPYSLTWDTRTAANGAHSLSVKAYDVAGFVGVSQEVGVTVSNDTTPPTVAFTSPAAGATISGSINVTATASDNVKVTRVELYDGTTLISTDPATPFSLAWGTRTVANGEHTITLKAYDAAGNIGTVSEVVNVNNDRTAPTVTLTAPSDGATMTGSVTLSATASDNVSVSRVEFYVGTMMVGSDYYAPYSYTLNSRSIANGVKSITAKAYDASGNSASSNAVSVTFDNDLTAPTTSITSPTAGSTVSGVVTISAVASDDRGVITKVEFYAGGTLLGTSTTAPYTWNWDTTRFSTGTYSLKSRAIDPSNNATFSSYVQVTVTR